MNKNILEEYQKRVTEILEALGTYQAIISEGIEEAQSRTDNRLSELQTRREELEQPIDMSDVSATVIDMRIPAKSEYSDDREGYLLSEYDKRRLDGYEGPKYAEIVDEIRTIRENRRLEQIEAVEEEMQELIEEQSDIDHAREAEADKSNLMVQLKEERDRIEANIQSNRESIEKEMAKFGEAFEEGEVHLQALALYKDETSKVYTAAKTEHKKCVKKAESAQNRMKRLSRKIAHLEQDLAQVDELLDSLLTDEISRQEDEMWKEYRAEQEKQTAKMEENKDYIMNAEMELHNGEEKAEEEKTQKQTEREIRAYGDTGITPEDELPSETYKVPLKEKDTERKNPQPPTAGQKPQVPPTGKGLFKIVKAGLNISDNGLPTYYVELTNEKGDIVELVHYEQNNGYYKVIVPGKEQMPELQKLQEQLIANPKKYYDFGLVGLLKEVDKKYGTTGEKTYVQMLKEKDTPSDSKTAKGFAIDYDLSNLGIAPIDQEDKVKVRYLKSIARASSGVGLATYQKAPSIWSKIATFVKEQFSKVTRKRIEQADFMQQPANTSNIAREAEETLGYSVDEIEAICRPYRSQYKDPTFNIANINGITEEEREIISEDYKKEKAADEARKKFKSSNNANRRKVENNDFFKRIKNIPGAVAASVSKEPPSGSRVGVPKQVDSENKRGVRQEVLKDYTTARKIGEFDVEKFIKAKGLTEEEATEVRRRQTKYMEARKLHEEHLAKKATAQKKDDDVIEVDPKDVRLLDEDGREI